MKSAHTVVIERNTVAVGALETEPYEVGWATEALWFVEPLDPLDTTWRMRVRISPDGLRWCEHGDEVREVSSRGLTALPVARFGSWLQLVLSADDPAACARVMITLALK